MLGTITPESTGRAQPCRPLADTCVAAAYPAVLLSLEVCAHVEQCCVEVLHGIVVGPLHSNLERWGNLQDWAKCTDMCALSPAHRICAGTICQWLNDWARGLHFAAACHAGFDIIPCTRLVYPRHGSSQHTAGWLLRGHPPHGRFCSMCEVVKYQHCSLVTSQGLLLLRLELRWPFALVHCDHPKLLLRTT